MVGSRVADTRASAPLGAVLLIGITVLLASSAGAAMLGVTGVTPGASDSSSASADSLSTGPPPTASLEVSATVDGRVTVTHTGGDTLDVRELRMRILVDGTPLATQPPVPFFSAHGFYSGPEGPINTASDSSWLAGETASLTIAGTNDPQIGPGSQVRIEMYALGHLLAREETAVQADRKNSN